MAVRNVMKLEWTDGGLQTVQFTDNEVRQVEVVTNQRYYVKNLLNGQPLVYYHGDQWHELFVDIILWEPATAGHIATLKTVDEHIEMTMYYQNGKPSGFYGVRIDPNVDLKYMAGYPSAGPTIRLHFWEVLSTKTPAVEITYLPIGRT